MSEPLDNVSTADVSLPRPQRRQLKVSDGAIFFRSKMDRIAKTIFQTRIGVVLFIGVLSLEVFSLYWSLATRLPIIDNNLSLLSQQMQLTSKLTTQQKEWSEDEFNKIEQDISLAEAQIFNNVGELAVWLVTQNTYAKSLGINMTYSIDDPTQLSLKNTFSFPIEILLRVEQVTRESPYINMLEFTQHMIQGHRHLEIQGAEIKSDGSAIVSFTLNINLWVQDSTEVLKASDHSIKSLNEETMNVPFT